MGIALVLICMALLSHSPRVRTVAGTGAAVLVVAMVVEVLMGRRPPAALVFPVMAILFAVYVFGIRSRWKGWP